MARISVAIYDEGDTFGSRMDYTVAATDSMGATSALLQSLEEHLLRPEVRHDPAQVGALLAADFREFGSSGQVFTRETVLSALRAESRCEISLRDFVAMPLREDVCLVTYRSVRYAPGGEAREALRSSVWRREEGEWRVVFHQGTPAPQSSGESVARSPLVE